MNYLSAQSESGQDKTSSRRRYFRSGVWPLILVAVAVTMLPAFSQAPADSPTLTADRHRQKGVTCAACHGQEVTIDKNGPVATATFVDSARCLGCHGPADALIRKTAAVKPANPHNSPHWGQRMDCAVCHRQHEKTVNWCAHCHAFKFTVP